MQGIYNYARDTNHVSRVNNIAVIIIIIIIIIICLHYFLF
jgi:hypothetical protein